LNKQVYNLIARFSHLNYGLLSESAPFIEEFKRFNVDAMTPLEALNALAEMKRKAGK
jgi:hypothetical protein